MIGRFFLLAFMAVTATASAPGSVAAQPRPVSLTASDGITLKGTFYPASQPGPGVLLLHQCNRDRTAWKALAEPLAAAGLSVLAVDYRGFGESAGPRFAELRAEALAKAQARWPSDIDLAIEHLASQPGVTRDMIGVAGASCGVNNAVLTARRDPRVKSLVLMAGTTDRRGRAFLRTGRRVPALFVLAEDDEFPVSILTTRWLYGLTATPQKQLLVYPNGGHGADMFAPQPDLVPKIVDWFVTSLRTTPGQAPVPARAADTRLDMSLLAALDDPGGPTRIAAQMKKRATPPAREAFPEGLVNGVGYEYLADNPAHAVAVFTLNVQAYPASPNAHDSLADGYVATGQKDLARTHAQQALTLLESARDLPDALRQAIRESAEAKLKQLGGASAGITAAGQPAQLDIRVAGESSIRVTLKPLTFKGDFPVNPAIATRAYPAPALTLREIKGPVQKKVGALMVDVRPDPLTLTVTNSTGLLVQRITFAADDTLSFKLDEHPVLGMGEGGPRPQPGSPWRQQAVQFDRRGQLDTMQPRWQADMYGSRNPSAMMLGTSGWGLFVAAPWGQIDLRDAERGVHLPWKPTDADRAPQTERNQQQNLAKGLPAPDAVVPGLYDIFIFDAHDPARAMKDFSVITGPAALPPLWALGYMQSHRTLQDDAQMLGIVETFRKKNIPLDAVIYLGTGFVPRGWNTRQPSFTFNPDVFKRDPKGVIADMHAQNVKVIVHMVPWDRDKLPTLHGTIPPAPGETLDASHIHNYWQQHVPLVKSGIDAFWPDEGDWFNLFERIKRHQLYYQGHLSTTPNVRPWSLQRNGHPGIAQWGGWVWSGDTDSSWKTLEAQVAVGINYSLSIGPYWGSDIGGFYPNSELTGELYARWFQFAAFCGSFRSHGRVWWTRLPWGWGLSDRGPQEYGNNNAPIPPDDRRNILMSEMNNPAIEPVAKKYAELRYQLLPYTYTLAWEARQSGMPLMRAMWLHYPDDPALRGLGTQFMWGRDLLVSPVFTKGATSRDVYLPKGDWYDWWTNAKSSGGTSVTRAVDLATMPIYVRAGAIIPFDPVRQYTSQPVSEPTTLRIYGGADGEYTLYEDDGISQDYVKAKGTWTRLSWNDRTKQLTMQPGAPKGATNVGAKRVFRVTLLPEGTVKDVTYAGTRIQVRF